MQGELCVFKPTYDVKNAAELVAKLAEFEEKSLGGIDVELLKVVNFVN